MQVYDIWIQNVDVVHVCLCRVDDAWEPGGITEFNGPAIAAGAAAGFSRATRTVETTPILQAELFITPLLCANTNLTWQAALRKQPQTLNTRTYSVEQDRS